MKARFALLLLFVMVAFGMRGAAFGASGPSLLRDKEAARFLLAPSNDPTTLDDVIQPDTQIEPSIAVNPKNPLNAVAGFQEGRRSNGGDMTNGFATTSDGGKTWRSGEVPGLTRFVGGAKWDRASDAVVAFGPDGTAFYNSLVFDLESEEGLCSGLAMNLSHDGGRTWTAPVFFQDDCAGGLNDKNWVVVDTGTGAGHHPGRVYVVWDRVVPVVYNYCDSLQRDCSQSANWLPTFKASGASRSSWPTAASASSTRPSRRHRSPPPAGMSTPPSDSTSSSSRWPPALERCPGLLR